MNNNRALLIGIDGGTYSIIDKLLDKGHLNNLNNLIRRGARANLISTIPPVTTTAWTSMVTGMNPGKTSVFGISEPLEGLFSRQQRVSRILGLKSMWISLAINNRKCININVPMTFPPPRIKNCIFIPGPPIIPTKNIPIHPQTICKKLLKEFPDYKIIPKLTKVKEKEFIQEVYEILKLRTKVAIWLMKEFDWNLFFVVYWSVDPLEHFYWKYMDNENADKELREAIFNAYKIVDEGIGKLLREAGNDVSVIVLSDHGMGPCEKVFQINALLERLKLLRLRTIYRIFRPLIKLTRWRPFKQAIDWKRTIAYSWGAAPIGAIRINTDFIPPNTQQYQELIDKLVRQLGKITLENKPLISRILKREEIYWGPYTRKAPELFIFSNISTISFASSILENSLITEPPEGRSADHRMNGIFILYDKSVSINKKLTKVSILDVAPTVLQLLGLNPPKYMDGDYRKIITEP